FGFLARLFGGCFGGWGGVAKIFLAPFFGFLFPLSFVLVVVCFGFFFFKAGAAPKMAATKHRVGFFVGVVLA
ncbi:hypothetical protein, partial [Aeromonas veronii]|uniref:hypothetical protein n=1 Tax=Aeromonas veronii TaxID=654 RepID=UPI0038B65A7B